MRQRSSPIAKRASESGHIVVIDDQECFPTRQIPAGASDASKGRKRQSSVGRISRKLLPLVVVGLCLQGAYLLRKSPLSEKLAAASARVLGESARQEDKASSEQVASPDNGEEVNVEEQQKEEEQKQDQEEKQAVAVPKASGSANISIPDVLVVGAQFSGTAAVASWLFHHDNVCKPQSIQSGKPIKEARFFDAADYASKNTPQEYAKHFSHCAQDEKKTHIVDATSDYFQYASRVREVYDKVGDDASKKLKVVVVVREPMDREFSWYQYVLAQAKKPNPPKYTSAVKNRKGQFINFERYLDNNVLPKLKSSHAGYAKFFQEWTDKFDRRQLLVLSYDELANDTESARGRLEKFLNLESDSKIPSTTLEVKSVNKNIPSCAAQNKLADLFEDSNNELYKRLDANKGPDAEQRPFPHFQISGCKPAKQDKKENVAKDKVVKAAKEVKKSPAKAVPAPKKVSKPTRRAPKTVFFATHHKTGTDISRNVASLLKLKGYTKYSTEEMDEKNLMKTADGKDVKCLGGSGVPEIRSYNQWPKWIIDNLWGKCVGKWWEKWPAETTTDKLFEKCIMGEMDSLKDQLKKAACGDNYLVVHFVRNPVDLMLSSYRYTKLGKEEWMHENIVGHPRFLGEYCGDNEGCFDMTIQEAVRDLPTEVGLKLDMHLTSMETVKQMMVAAVLAKGDPEHHITVSLSDIMESSKSFNKAWYNIISGVFPDRKPDFIQKIVKSLSKFDMNADPENFVGNGHSTAGKTSKKETDEHKASLEAEEGVKQMMNDPIIKTLM